MISQTKSIIAFSCFAALVTWFAVLLDLYVTLSNYASSGKSLLSGLVHYLGFFTVITGIFCALIFSANALPFKTLPLLNFLQRPTVLTTAESSIIGVAAVYHLVLRNLWIPTGLQALSSFLLHYTVPFVYSIFWWCSLPRNALRWSDLQKICLYPIAYGLYIFLRGEALSEYPYPFFDVNTIGYFTASLNAAAIFSSLMALSAMLIAVNRNFAHDTSQ